MSKNFALLHKVGKETLLKVPSTVDAPPVHDSGIQHLQNTLPDREANKSEKDSLSARTYDLSSGEVGPRPTEESVAIEKEAAQPKPEMPARLFHGEPLLHLRRQPQIHLGKAAQEQVIKLVQRVFVIPNSHGPRVIVFSSVDERAESGEICCHAGHILAAQVSGAVCLVDANLQAPLLHRLWGVNNAPGLADAAMRPGPIQDFAMRIDGGNLWVLPPGSQAAGVPGLFSYPQWHLRIEELKEAFDYILIDAAPVTCGADAVLLGQRADGVILVLEAHATRRETARKAKETLQGSNVKLLGAVLNNRTFPVPEAIYRKL